ncbi:MAG: hypothetical protein RR593_04575 [Hungatella sp.]
MKVFRMNGKDNSLEFTNYDRIDEEELFNAVMNKLKSNQNVLIGEQKKGPSEDFYECTIGNEPFTLWHDIDFGPSIHSKNEIALKMLTEYFNN